MKTITTTEPEDITQFLYNLAQTLAVVKEIDPMLLDESEQAKLKRLLTRIFNAIECYSRELPKVEKKQD